MVNSFTYIDDGYIVYLPLLYMVPVIDLEGYNILADTSGENPDLLKITIQLPGGVTTFSTSGNMCKI